MGSSLYWKLTLFCLLGFFFAASSPAAELRIYPGRAFHVLGDKADEWRFESSTNLFDWADAPELGSAFSDDHVRPLTNSAASSQYFLRALRTKGLFEDRLLRTIHLTFAMTNWMTNLYRGRQTGSNTPCLLVMDNGLTNTGVGARYKGNSSFNETGRNSINLEIDYTDPNARLMGQKTINLNNADDDETILRELLYFNAMSEYAPSPKASLANLYINNDYWGVYTLAQQENSVLIDEWFPSTNGDRWRTANFNPFADMSYRGTNILLYHGAYDLRSADNSTNAWTRLTNAIWILHTTPTNTIRDRLEDIYAVDRWLWFFAVENVFTDPDSYEMKGADYSFYYEPESGRFHPIEHDGNESLSRNTQHSPLYGLSALSDFQLPLLRKTLGNPELRQRYLAHMRTVLAERFHPDYLMPIIDRLHRLSYDAITADTKKVFAMSSYAEDLRRLRSDITNRYQFLTNHPELTPLPPIIQSVHGPAESPTASETPAITARVSGGGTNGISSVWLYHRIQRFGKFTSARMFDDGLNSDRTAGDSVYSATITNYPPGTLVRYYLEARSDNTNRTAAFSPARAEQVTYTYRVRLSELSDSPVVINEFMALNTSTLTDPQGEYDDWIELHNLSNQTIDLSGMYLSDDPDQARKWRFLDGTTIAPGAYLLVWADEDGAAPTGLHANFKLATDGEEILLVDSDARQNRLLDHVTFGKQGADYSHGRDPAAPATFKDMPPTPAAPNR